MKAERTSGWGGKRPNQGRKRGTKARVYLRLADEDAKSLYLYTKHQRALLNKPELTEEEIVGEWARQAWRELDRMYQEAAIEAQEPYIL